MSLSIAHALFEALDKAQIPHCHFKSNVHLREALAGETDLDLLVDLQRALEVESLLSELRYRRVLSQEWACFSGIEDWIGFDPETTKLVHLHLHYRLRSGLRHVKEQRIPWEAEILKSAVLDEIHGVRVTEPALELLLLLLRLALKNPGRLNTAWMPELLSAELDWLRARSRPEQVQAWAQQLLPSAAEAVAEALRGDLSSPRRFYPLRAALLSSLQSERHQAPLSAQLKHKLQRARFQRARVLRKLELRGQWGKRLHSGGRIIAIIGCDGSGKSSLAQDLLAWLSWKLDVRRLYLGVGDGEISWSTRLLKGGALRAQARQDQRSAQRSASATQPKMGGLKLKQAAKDLGVGLLNLSFAQERARKLRRAAALRQDGVILITDRYPQDQVRGIYDGPRTLRKAQATPIRERFAQREDALFGEMKGIRPDLVIRLNVSVEVALARKPQHKRPEISRKVKLTPQLHFPGSQLVDLDAEQPIEEVSKAARRAIWMLL